MRCANCAEEIRPVRDSDGIDESDRDQFPWVDEAGNPICGTLTHEPAAPFSWRDMFARYAESIKVQEGYYLMHESDWTAEEWAAITALPGMERPV